MLIFLVWFVSGTGGEEASLFAMDVFKMWVLFLWSVWHIKRFFLVFCHFVHLRYDKYSLKKGWKFEVLNLAESDLKGYKVHWVSDIWYKHFIEISFDLKDFKMKSINFLGFKSIALVWGIFELYWFQILWLNLEFYNFRFVWNPKYRVLLSKCKSFNPKAI